MPPPAAANLEQGRRDSYSLPDARQGSGLYRVSASGGTPTQINKPRPESCRKQLPLAHVFARWNPLPVYGGEFYGRKEVNAIFVGSLDSKEKRFILQATANAAYAAPGYLLFLPDKIFWPQGFDLQSFALTGEAATNLSEIQYHPLDKKGRIRGFR